MLVDCASRMRSAGSPHHPQYVIVAIGATSSGSIHLRTSGVHNG